MESNTNTDSWSSILSQLGVDTPDEERSVASSVSEPVAEAVIAEAEPRLKDTVPESPVAEPSTIEEPKRSGESRRAFFDRFPKINLFGTPPKDPLDAVVAGTKPTMKPTETFTSKKLEKVDPLPGRPPRREPETATPPVSPPVPVPKVLDPWALIASQVGNLTVPEVNEPVTPETVVDQPWEAPKEDVPRRDRYAPPSMFDGSSSVESGEPTAIQTSSSSQGQEQWSVESKESTAVRTILDTEEPRPFAEAAERLSSIFDDNAVSHNGSRRDEAGRADFRREEGGRHHESESRRNEDGRVDSRRGKSPRRDDPVMEKRGRGSRRDTPPNEEPMWDIEEESKPVERSSRRPPRYSERSERETAQPHRFRERQKEIADGTEDAVFASSGNFDLHHSIPSWDDAISAIIEANVARRTKHGSRGRGARS